MRIPIKNKNQGFSLMEVLMSMIIIAIGILGFMALQMLSLNSTQDGFARSNAVLIAQQLATSMRVNRNYINADKNNDAYVTTSVDSSNCGAKPAICDANDSNCSAQNQAKFDMWQACMSMVGFTTSNDTDFDNALVNGKLHVECSSRVVSEDCSPGSLHTIYVYWEGATVKSGDGQYEIDKNTRCIDYAKTKPTLAAVVNAAGNNYQCAYLDVVL